MRAGRLRTRLSLQSPSTAITRGSGGVRTESWTTEATVWAERLDIGGSEDLEGGREHASVSATWRMRHRTDIDSSWRLVTAGSTSETWEVLTAFDPNGRRQEIHVKAARRGA